MSLIWLPSCHAIRTFRGGGSGPQGRGFLVSVDSLDDEDLLRGGRAGADFLLSLSDSSLWIAEEVASTPILIPSTHGDLASLDRVIERFSAKGREFIVDPILDPIHFGFADSLVRYHTVRTRYPEIEMMMGVGNLTELTHADTAGINALLLGICSELGIRQILATQVSRHARRSIREADVARRIMYAAREANRLPKHIDDGLMALHERNPFPLSHDEIIELQTAIRDPSYRILAGEQGLYVFNREGLHEGDEPFTFFRILASRRMAAMRSTSGLNWLVLKLLRSWVSAIPRINPSVGVVPLNTQRRAP